MHSLQDLYVEQLRDIYSAETQLLNALPKMSQAAVDTELRQAFADHLNQTQGHVSRLEQIFEALDIRASGETCQAMQELINEGEDMVQQQGKPAVKDAGLIAQAQRIEHYEIASYGTLCTYAERLGEQEAYRLLRQTLGEEKETDTKLNQLAKGSINKRAKAA